MKNHRNSRKNRVEVFTFGRDGSTTRYHFHEHKGCKSLPRILDEMRRDGGIAVLVRHPRSVGVYFIEGARAWWTFDSDKIKGAFAEIRTAIAETVTINYITRKAGSVLLRCKTCSFLDSSACSENKTRDYACHSSTPKEPEHREGEPCNLPIYEPDTTRARGFNFVYTGEKRVPLNEWIATKWVEFYENNGELKDWKYWILRAVPKWEPKGRVQWDGKSSFPELWEDSEPQEMMVGGWPGIKQGIYWIKDDKGYGQASTIEHLFPLTEPAKPSD